MFQVFVGAIIGGSLVHMFASWAKKQLEPRRHKTMRDIAAEDVVRAVEEIVSKKTREV